ncbi:hypothetical protein LTR85_012225 [Meristemomyces frigidus]|nr:hypothetical protein LTR85_012225 [Meristemomyces frigidus]
MLFRRLCQAALLSVAAVQTAAMTIGGKPGMMTKPYKRAPLQNIVTWDEHSLFVRGERIMFYSGEFHPFRLPVPGLWLDVFQKIKALGYNGVSFYTDWALLEGKQGEFNASGVFALEPFFEAAQTAGIYLLARPGPYINAEALGGGYPGWLQRDPALLRTRDLGYEHATDNYVAHIGAIVAAAQITNGGLVILVQLENEYSQGIVPAFPDPIYFGYYRNAGIVVPLISNDAYPHGYFADGPLRRPSAVDIYGHDGYPLGFDCANPYTWPDDALPTYYLTLYEEQSSSTPYSIVELEELLSPEFERVFYKNDFSFSVTIFNIYMTYRGTNWGNLGHPGTSYDYGAMIDEMRVVTREKYSEAKLEANFLQASPAYFTAVAQNNTNANGSYTGNDALAVTALLGNVTNFFVIRHAAYNSLNTTNYHITLPTSKGNITIPQLGGSLSLHGRDSKFHVSDYNKQYGNKRVLVIYGGLGGEHELAVASGGHVSITEGSGVKIAQRKGATVLNWQMSSERKVVDLSCDLKIYILDRNSAYDYWVIDLPSDLVTRNYTNYAHFNSAPIVKAGYLLRTVEVADGCIHLTGDLNSTTALEVIGGAPSHISELTWNSESIPFKQDHRTGVVTATATYKNATYSIPNLSAIG